jgi:hypothetical protein
MIIPKKQLLIMSCWKLSLMCKKNYILNTKGIHLHLMDKFCIKFAPHNQWMLVSGRSYFYTLGSLKDSFQQH